MEEGEKSVDIQIIQVYRNGKYFEEVKRPMKM